MEQATVPVKHSTPDGLTLSTRAWGRGRPQILLVHGFGDNALVWDHFAGALADQYGLLAVDLRGHGASVWDPTGIYALQDFVVDVRRVLEQFHGGRTLLVGHSLGAQIVIRLAAACWQSICGLVVVDLPFKDNPRSAAHIRQQVAERQRHAYAAPAQYVTVLRGQLPLAHPALLEKLADRALRERVDGLFELSGDPMLVNLDDSVDEQTTLSLLKQIKRPILFVRGEGSAILSRGAARELLAEVPQSRMSVVSRAGHAVMLDNPEGFRDAVKPFVLRVLSPPVNAMREG